MVMEVPVEMKVEKTLCLASMRLFLRTDWSQLTG